MIEEKTKIQNTFEQELDMRQVSHDAKSEANSKKVTIKLQI